MNTTFTTFSKNAYYVSTLLFFLIAFFLITFLFTKQQNQHDRVQFVKHATIISGDIWAFNDAGASTYLKLAMETDHYKSVNVSIPGAEDFIVLKKAPLTGLSYFLYSAGLIQTKEMTQPIYRQETQIGSLSAEKYVRTIFPIFNILLVLLLILMTSSLIISLFNNRRLLEHEVEVRTRNLQHSEQRFHDLVNFLPEIVFETDMDGNITYANQAAISGLDPKLSSHEKKSFLDFIDEKDRNNARKSFYTSLQGEPTGLQEYLARRSDDHLFPVLLKIAPIFTNDLLIAGARMVVIDISSRRQLEEQLLRDQKMKAIGLMAGGVAHDLNNILSGIISYPDLLLLDLPEEDRLYKPLQSIRRSGVEAAEVVSDLLTVARGVAASTEVLSLNELIHNYLESPDFKELTSRHPDVRIVTELDSSLGNVDCSPIHVRKCLMNIINNGIESIKGQGTLTISSVNEFCSLPATTAAMGLSPAKDLCNDKRLYSKIIISDTGEGIDAKEMQHIFEPFYSTKVMGRSGTGLGLTIVWNTMRDHDGAVQVASSEEGTSFELFFPSLNVKVNSQSKEKSRKDYTGNGETILVVDDEPRQREILKSLLGSLLYKVVVVPSGEQAEEYLLGNSVDLVVLDMLMPPGQNGRTTYENILKIHAEQKAVIASGFAKDDDVQATLAMGASAFIAKPYTIEQIGSAIYNALHS